MLLGKLNFLKNTQFFKIYQKFLHFKLQFPSKKRTFQTSRTSKILIGYNLNLERNLQTSQYWDWRKRISIEESFDTQWDQLRVKHASQSDTIWHGIDTDRKSSTSHNRGLESANTWQALRSIFVIKTTMIKPQINI